MTPLAARLLPYAIGAAVLFGAGFAAGHRWQAGEVADAEKAQQQAEGERDKWQDAAGEWQRAQGLWAKRYADDQEQAKRQKEAAERELAKIAGEEARARQEAANWQARFTAAKKEPSCKALMEESTCSVFSSDY